MEVKSINYLNSQQNFGSIYVPKNAKFTRHQRVLANYVRRLIQNPAEEFNGLSAEKFYKSKGIDFKITPEYKDTIILTGYKDLKEMGTGKNKWTKYSDFIYIGDYNKKEQFNVTDIDKSFKDRNFNNKLLIGAFITLPVAIVTSFLLNLNPQTQDTIKPLIEQVDSAKNKVSSIIADTSKVFKFVKK